MRSVKKKSLAVLVLSLCLLFSLCGTAMAQEQRVFDSAGLFTAEQSTQMSSRIDELRMRYQMDFVVVTTTDTEGKSARDFSDDFFDYGGYGMGAKRSGVLFLIDMEHREVYISTSGDMIRRLTDARIHTLLNGATDRLQKENYAGAVQGFLDRTAGYLGEKRMPSVGTTVLFAAIACAVGGACCASIVLRYKGKVKRNPYPYQSKGCLNLSVQEDVYLYAKVTSVRIETTSSSSSDSGGSSTHTSSSGNSHGGGGASF